MTTITLEKRFSQDYQKHYLYVLANGMALQCFQVNKEEEARAFYDQAVQNAKNPQNIAPEVLASTVIE